MKLNRNAPACLQKQEKQIAPGVYVCAEKHVHIVVPELCRAAGYEPTPANIAVMSKAALDVLKQNYPDTAVNVVE